MSNPGKAVFISYASQEAEAARKICDALRAAGIEVWFDQSELVGGDAWDQKIRGQIKACALFVPAIVGIAACVALAITPEAADALYALSIVRLNQAAYAESESFARRAMAANPDDGYIRRALSQAVRRLGRGEEAEEILKEALRLNPRDALTHYNLGSLYANIAGSTASPERLAVGLKHFDAALAVEPFASALVQKAGLVAAWKGDLMSMRAALNQLEKMSSAERAEARDLIAPVELAARDLPNLNGWLGKYYAACGDAPNATRLVRTRIDRATFFTRHCLRLDPWWDKLRGQPDFEALLAEPKAQPARETKK